MNGHCSDGLIVYNSVVSVSGNFLYSTIKLLLVIYVNTFPGFLTSISFPLQTFVFIGAAMTWGVISAKNDRWNAIIICKMKEINKNFIHILATKEIKPQLHVRHFYLFYVKEIFSVLIG